MTHKFTLEENERYWEDPGTVSLADENLRTLEVDFVRRLLKFSDVLADVGCGDAVATRRYAPHVAEAWGLERSERLLGSARATQAADPLPNLRLEHADILELGEYAGRFDVVVTERVLINLPSWELQARAIDSLAGSLKPGGMYVMLEVTEDGQGILDDWRAAAGLPPIGARWHNLPLDFEQLAAYVEPTFELVERSGFDLFYLLTRVYTPMFAEFVRQDERSANIYDAADGAARRLFTLLGDRISVGGAPVFGPVQGIVLRKREGA